MAGVCFNVYTFCSHLGSFKKNFCFPPSVEWYRGPPGVRCGQSWSQYRAAPTPPGRPRRRWSRGTGGRAATRRSPAGRRSRHPHTPRTCPARDPSWPSGHSPHCDTGQTHRRPGTCRHVTRHSAAPRDMSLVTQLLLVMFDLLKISSPSSYSWEQIGCRLQLYKVGKQFPAVSLDDKEKYMNFNQNKKCFCKNL